MDIQPIAVHSRHYVFNASYELVYYDDVKKRYGFEFEHMSDHGLFYLICEIDAQVKPNSMNHDAFKHWIITNRDRLAELTEIKHVNAQSKNCILPKHSVAKKFSVLLSFQDINTMGLETAITYELN